MRTYNRPKQRVCDRLYRYLKHVHVNKIGHKARNVGQNNEGEGGRESESRPSTSTVLYV